LIERSECRTSGISFIFYLLSFIFYHKEMVNGHLNYAAWFPRWQPLATGSRWHRLLRMRGERPRRRCAAQDTEEILSVACPQFRDVRTDRPHIAKGGCSRSTKLLSRMILQHELQDRLVARKN
jgi:hypothetical protein